MRKQQYPMETSFIHEICEQAITVSIIVMIVGQSGTENESDLRAGTGSC